MNALLFGLLMGPMQTTMVTVTVPSGRCRVVLNGRRVSFARFAGEAKRWTKTQPEIHFTPSPEADYSCVDRALRVLRDASVTKLGFIGNEAEDPGFAD